MSTGVTVVASFGAKFDAHGETISGAGGVGRGIGADTAKGGAIGAERSLVRVAVGDGLLCWLVDG